MPCCPWVLCIYSLSEAQGLAPKVSRLGVAPQRIHPATVPPQCVPSLPWEPYQLLGTLRGQAQATALVLLFQLTQHCSQELVQAHPPWHRQDVTRPHLPSAHHPWSGSHSGTPEDLPKGSSPGLAGGCVTGTLPGAGGGRGLWAPELAAVSPFTHSIK